MYIEKDNMGLKRHRILSCYETAGKPQKMLLEKYKPKTSEYRKFKNLEIPSFLC
jgi:hypothetical protein